MSAVRSSDVIVVGAGFAGLRAARDLRDAGLDVVVLEGRDRVGGRAYTRPFQGSDQDIDLGGSWVVPERQPRVAQEIDRYGLSLVHSPAPESYRTNVGGQRLTGPAPVSMTDLAELERAVFELVSASRRLAFGSPYDTQGIADLDVSFTEFLDRHSLPASVVEYLSTWNPSAHPDDVTVLGSLSWLAGFGNSAWNLYSSIDRKFEGGAQGLAHTLADSADLDLRLDTPVAEISIADDGTLEVVTRAGDVFVAPAGVLAVPLNTWKDITFQPELDQTRTSIARAGHQGAGQKIWVHLEGAPPGLWGIGKSPVGLNWLFEEWPASPGNLSVGFATPYPTGTTLDFTDLQVVQDAVEFFAPKARVLGVDYHDWNADEFSQGTWIAHRPGVISRFHSALREPHGPLHFAGTDVSYGWAAWFEGALETGAAAARGVLLRLRRHAG